MKVETDAILTCSACGVEGSHELLYLSQHLCASRCTNCGETHVYSGHIYVDYARDLADRTLRLPGRFVRDALQHATGLVKLPFKVARKPFRLLREVSQVSVFDQSRHTSTPGRRIS